MKIARMAILGVAVLAAGGAAIMASSFVNTPVQGNLAKNDEPKIELTEILVAKKDIVLGTRLDASMVRWQK